MFVDKGNREAIEKLAKEVELQKIHIKKSDIETIINELEVPFATAEKALRENQGEVVDAIISLLR
jgi:NACalpha-BTF3-like transcription factor